jgi:hypothetical protein
MRMLVRVLIAAAAVVVSIAPVAAQSTEAPSAPAAVDPFYVDPSAPDAPEATFFSYYHVLGVSMTPRDGTSAVVYDGLGCAHLSPSGFATYPVTIPDGSLIKYVRLYFCDTNVGSDVTAWLTEYTPPGVGFTDLVNVASGSSAGCGTVLSAELTYTVSNLDALAVLSSGSAADRQYCGIRIAYYEP